MNKKSILITGSAGFIGFHLAHALLEKGVQVVGFDNLNDYYEVSLKEDRLRILEKNKNFTFIRGNLADKAAVEAAFAKCSPRSVVNLAAQAGVRYSIDHPDAYIESNIVGFYNILEACRHYPVEHLVYASSSSVYGNQQKTPFSVLDDVSHPISLYAATKKTDELMAYTYSHLYGIPTTGLRFFTVYGPYGRPDMAYFSFAKKMVRSEPIIIFNHGNMKRDFTYVDDIVNGIVGVMQKPPAIDENGDRYKLYNIGNSKPEDLLHFIEVLENCLMREGVIDRPAVKEFLPMQPGDVYQTYADVDELVRDFGFKPSTTIEEGLARFAKWYCTYYDKSRV